MAYKFSPNYIAHTLTHTYMDDLSHSTVINLFNSAAFLRPPDKSTFRVVELCMFD
jgi:hypothetical protein